LEVPIGSVAAYKNANTWKEFNIVGIEVGIVETQGIASLQLYPNPTNGEFRVSSSEFKIENIEIFDVMGRKVQGFEFRVPSSETLNLKPETRNPKPETTINVSHLPTGIYFIRIQTENDVITQKIVKQ